MSSAAARISRALPSARPSLSQVSRITENTLLSPSTSTHSWRSNDGSFSSPSNPSGRPERALPPHLAQRGSKQSGPSSSKDWYKPHQKSPQSSVSSKLDWKSPSGRTRLSDTRFSPRMQSSSERNLGASTPFSKSPTERWPPPTSSGGNETRPRTYAELQDEVRSESVDDDGNWALETGVQNDHTLREVLHKKHGKGSGNTLRRLADEREQPSKKHSSSKFLTPKPLSSKAKTKVKLVEKVSTDVYIPKNITVANLSRLLGTTHKRLLNRMKNVGMKIIDSNHMLTSDEAYVLALEFDRNPIVDDAAAFDLYPQPLPTDQSTLPLRPPVITIMGHVDHGKTTLLDTLRSSSVASGEAGGITQHIGAFSVPVPSLSTSPNVSIASSSDAPRTITFLDTPGHAAFSAMRARGAGVTDIIVLVVAADDGVMPQTKEVIRLATASAGALDDLASGVGLVVAINKVDKPGSDVNSIKQALYAEGVQLEDFGGDVPSVEVSGLTGQGLDKLVETLSTLAEIKELRARSDGMAEGRVLESRVDKGRGPVATILVTQGVLTAGSHIVAGTSWARVRQMTDSSGKLVKSAAAGTPVTISGWKDLPQAGDEMIEGKESEVKSAVENRKRNRVQEALARDVQTINEKRMKEKEAAEATAASQTTASNTAPGPALSPAIVDSAADGVKELRIMIKADVSGSAEAVAGALQDIGNEIAKVRIISSSVGDPTEADIDMAQAVGATLVGFSVKASSKILNHAATSGVPILTNTVIYRLMEDVRTRVQALLPTVIEQRVLGEAVVQQLFDIKGKGKNVIKIAGCKVTNGIIERSKMVRVLRDGEELFSGSLETFKQLKKDVTEIRKGSECGMALDGFDKFLPGDKIQSFEQIEKPGSL